MRANKVNAGRGFAWLECGSAFVRKDPWSWIGLGVLYLLIAVLFDHLPFVGPLILILLTPILLAGPFLTAEASGGAPPAAENPQGAAALARKLGEVAGQSVVRLLQGFTDPEKVLHVMVIGAFTLGAVVLMQIIGQILRIGSHTLTALPAALLSGNLSPALTASLIGLLLVLSIKLAVSMAVLYSVPLIVLRGEPPLAALQMSFAGCARNWLPLSLYSLPFLIVYAIVAALFALWRPLGYLALFSFGAVATTWFLAGVYCSYRDLYTPAPSPPP